VLKTVLITGTTSGIGYSFSKLFAARGNHVILVARNYDKLVEQQRRLQNKENHIDIIVCDLQRTEAAGRIYKEIINNDWHVDWLINNAGFNEAGLFTETDLNQEKAMVGLHINFTTELMKFLLPPMIKKGMGRILNVGSTGSYIACPKDAVYAATKAYVLHLSRAVNAELKNTGVSITVLCPGSTRTEFAKKADMEDTMLFKLFTMSADQVAEIGYKAMVRGKALAIPGIYNKLQVLSSRLLPYSIIGWMAKKML